MLFAHSVNFCRFSFFFLTCRTPLCVSMFLSHTHARTHASTHARTHTDTHTHTHTHARTHTHTSIWLKLPVSEPQPQPGPMFYTSLPLTPIHPFNSQAKRTPFTPPPPPPPKKKKKKKKKNATMYSFNHQSIRKSISQPK